MVAVQADLGQYAVQNVDTRKVDGRKKGEVGACLLLEREMENRTVSLKQQGDGNECQSN